MASEEQAQRQEDVLGALRRDLEAASYAARRAQRQYDAADPENRLVAGELERRWNEALQRVQEIEARIEAQGTHYREPSATPAEFAGLRIIWIWSGMIHARTPV